MNKSIQESWDIAYNEGFKAGYVKASLDIATKGTIYEDEEFQEQEKADQDANQAMLEIIMTK